jgi:two-component system sensor histidine kinase VicK
MTISEHTKKIAFPLFLLIAITLFKFAFNSALGNRTPFLLYTTVVIGTTWYSGWKLGLAMNFACMAVMDYFFLEPYFSFSFASRITTQMIIFSLQNVLIAAMGYCMTRALRKSEAAENKFRLLIEQACDLLVLRDVSGKAIYVSPKVTDMFGYAPHEYLAKDANEFFTKASSLNYQQCLQQLLNEPGAKKVLKLEFIRKDGTLGWLEVDLFNYLDEPGINALVSHCRDITSRVDIENQKAGFIGIASHELKTPLTSVKAYLQVLEAKASKTNDPFLLEALRKVNYQVKKMTDMINGFLNLSRLESGVLELNKVTFDLNEIVEEALQECKLIMPNRSVSLTTMNKAVIFADREKILSVINNLISNAAKYSKAEKPIFLSIEVNYGQVQLNVQDQGIGVKTGDKSKLFERYYRAYNEQTKVVSGFGIGLFLCAEIIRLHGGEIGLESEYEKGSTFYFKLPLAEQAAA